MEPTTRRKQSWLGLLAGMILLGGGVPTLAGTLHVANNGVDGPACGRPDTPCRSIGQAIANAGWGDTLVVGPGRYGDLNGNGILGEPGEEGRDEACGCMIAVGKSLKLLSRDGSVTTVLDADGANTTVVRILTDDVAFGAVDHGFTITGGSNALVVQGGTGVRVRGNVAVSNRDGFLIFGTGHTLRGNQALANTGVGFGVSGNRHTVEYNQAVANHVGYFATGSAHTLRANIATDSHGEGFFLRGDRYTFRSNAAVGNRGPGIVVDSAGLALRRNNIYGNNSAPSGGPLNCGLVNNAAGSVNATDNFWGAPGGPGADPADDVCNVGIGGSTTVFQPFATEEFVIPVQPPQPD